MEGRVSSRIRLLGGRKEAKKEEIVLCYGPKGWIWRTRIPMSERIGEDFRRYGAHWLMVVEKL